MVRRSRLATDENGKLPRNICTRRSFLLKSCIGLVIILCFAANFALLSLTNNQTSQSVDVVASSPMKKQRLRMLMRQRKIHQKKLQSNTAVVKKRHNRGTNDSILIAVATSRKMLSSRVATITNTWAKPEALTPDITVLFFVGRYGASSSSNQQQELFKSGSRTDRTILAQQAGLNNFSSIIVMPDVEDDEYPPVCKIAAMFKYLDKFVIAQEKDPSQKGYTWIFKADDDTYVNTKGLRDFLQSRESTDEYQFWGERGFGRKEDEDNLQKAGLVKPYCMGGPGYIMSRSLLRETALSIDTCIDNARTSIYNQYIWHSDVMVGLCAYNKTGVGCYEASDYSSLRPFRQNYEGTQDFVDDGDLSNIVSMHPFKESKEMTRQHARFLNQSPSKKMRN